MTTYRRTLIYLAALGVIGVAQVALSFETLTQEEREKRKKMRAWERTKKICLENSAKRIKKMMKDPTKTPDDILDAWKEEVGFMKIVKQQKPY